MARRHRRSPAPSGRALLGWDVAFAREFADVFDCCGPFNGLGTLNLLVEDSECHLQFQTRSLARAQFRFLASC